MYSDAKTNPSSLISKLLPATYQICLTQTKNISTTLNSHSIHACPLTDGITKSNVDNKVKLKSL